MDILNFLAAGLIMKAEIVKPAPKPQHKKVCAEFDAVCQTRKLLNKDNKISPRAAYQLLIGYLAEKQAGNIKKSIVTFVDFSKPSNDRRLQVINMDTYKVLFNTFVAHGARSGFVNARYFSNRVGSHESSLGFFKTLKTYYGQDGYSLRITGLQKGLNDNAYRRYIVVHPAWYVGKAALRQLGHTGRTWGCFGLPKKVARKIVNTIKGGSLIYAYYPGRVKSLNV